VRARVVESGLEMTMAYWTRWPKRGAGVSSALARDAVEEMTSIGLVVRNSHGNPPSAASGCGQPDKKQANTCQRYLTPLANPLMATCVWVTGTVMLVAHGGSSTRQRQ
jgi:hypothetical protein